MYRSYLPVAEGVLLVSQGWIASSDKAAEFSEAVIVTFDAAVISVETLIAVHLHSHSCTAEHTMRSRYRSAVYAFNPEQELAAKLIIARLQAEFDQPVITHVLPFVDFKLNAPAYLNYYYKDPSKPFCENIVNPKLKELMAKFADVVDTNTLTLSN